MDKALNWQKGHNNRPLPTMIPGIPVLGSALPMFKDPLEFMCDSYRNFGPIYRFRAFDQVFTVLSGPEANQFLTKADESYLTVKKVYAGVSYGMNSQHFLLNEDGEKHRELRKILRRGYSKQAIASQIPTLMALTKTMTDKWVPGQQIMIVPELKKLIITQLGQTLMGRVPTEYFDDLQTFFTVTAETSVSHQLPFFTLKLPFFRRLQSRLFRLVDEVVSAHQARVPTDENRDIIDDVLAAVDESGKPYPEDFVRAAVIGTYIAGIDTVALTCSFAVYALLKHPEVMRRVQDEVRSVFVDRPPTFYDLRKMEVLHAAFLEIMRYYPVAPGAPRSAADTFEFLGYRIEKGSNILVATSVTHFMPEFFPDPYRFDIDRYIEPRHEHRQSYTFAPFTLGEHTCLGAGMAEFQVMATIAALVNQVDLELDPPDYNVQVTAAPSRGPRKNFAVRVKSHL